MTSVSPTPMTAIRASGFLDSIGVNTHLGWWDTAWGVGNGTWAGAETKVMAELSYLDVKNIRDSTPQGGVLAEMTDLAKAGYKFDLSQNINNGQVALSSDMAALATLEAAEPGSIIAYEGANEYNSNSYTLNGQNSSGNLGWGAVDDQVSMAALRSNPLLAGIRYVAASTGSVSSAPVVTPYVDISNWHVYSGIGQQLKSNLAGAISAATATAPGKPVFITETGISSAATSQTTWGTAGDEYTQGLIDTNCLLDAYKDGASETFLYDLMDNNQASDLEDNFGLFNADGTPKAAATDIHDLTSILADTGSNAETFSANAISLAITGLPATASDMLLQKSNGINDLVLWNSGATVWSATTNSEVTPVTSPITVTLDGIHQTVNIYDPLVSSSPIQTLTDVSSVSVGLSKDPLIVEMSAGTVPAIPPPTKLGSGSSTLTLNMSEDAWRGDAQFTVSVDGTQVGGVQTAVASHTAGLAQEFDVSGNWAAGTHQVAVDFINDAWGGTATTDRNLYVDSASFNGAALLNSPIEQYSNGPATLFFTSGSDELDLFVNEDAWRGDAQFTVTVDGALVGGIDTATTLHSSGTSQKLALFGDWGSGAHTVSINFINDAWGGTAATDRNLYLTGASYDGTTVASAVRTFMRSGAQSFTIPATGSSIVPHAAPTTAVTTHVLSNGLNHSLVTSAGSSDVIKLGSGNAILTTQGADTVAAGSGSSTITAASGSLSVSGGSGSMTFIQGGASSTVLLGSGSAMIDITNGSAGGELTLSGFNPRIDTLHLSGYAGAGIRLEQVVQGSTQIILTDNTRINLLNFAPSNGHSVFS